MSARIEDVAAGFLKVGQDYKALSDATAQSTGAAVQTAVAADTKATSAQRAAGKTPEDFGAVGDGLADDTAAVAAWAASTGHLRVRGGAAYALSAEVAVYAKRIDATGARFLWASTAPAETKMFRLYTAGTTWTGGELDGNLRANEGIMSLVGRHHVTGVEAHGFRSTAGRAVGIRLEGPEGSTVKDCHIYDIYALGNNNGGDAIGPSRAILGTHNSALTLPHYWKDNVIHDIWGEEGDGLHMLYFSGTYPFLDGAGSVISGNRIYGCGRRCIKIQVSNVVLDDNDVWLDGGNSPPNQTMTPRLSTIGIIASSYINLTNNRVRNSVDAHGIGASWAQFEGSCRGLVIEGNRLSGGYMGLYMEGVEDSYVGGNQYSSVERAVAVGKCKRVIINAQTIIASADNGTVADITVQGDSSHVVVVGSTGLGGGRYALVDMRAPKSVVLDTFSLRTSGSYAVIGASSAVESIIDGVLTASDGTAFAVAGSDAVLQVNNVRNFGTTTEGNSNGGASRQFYAASDPSNLRVARKHYRGDIAWNSGSGPETGWRCAATGIPGTWVAF